MAEHAAPPLRALPLKKLPLLVAGDIVTCQQEPGSGNEIRIIELQPRKSSLSRPDRRGKLKPVAANLSCLLIVCAPQPEPDMLLLDQFCIVAHHNDLEPVIVLNKTDLLGLAGNQQADKRCEQILAAYRLAGIKTLEINTTEPPAWEALLDAIENKVAVLVGQSGVGKSSIIKRILPDQEIRVGALSRATGIGSHTTTVSCWYDLENSGALIDSPGVRQFAVDYLDPRAVASGYPEIANLAESCRFNDCLHRVEPGCAVLEQLQSEQSAISQLRYQNYLKLSTLEN